MVYKLRLPKCTCDPSQYNLSNLCLVHTQFWELKNFVKTGMILEVFISPLNGIFIFSDVYILKSVSLSFGDRLLWILLILNLGNCYIWCTRLRNLSITLRWHDILKSRNLYLIIISFAYVSYFKERQTTSSCREQ